MKPSWSKIVLPIASLYACRMLGLFLLIPVFTVFATKLEGATPQLIGIGFGAYGLAQACMQIPFGLLSDKIGRKQMIAFGLILLIIGSVIGAVTHSIWGMILARTIQGFGAIGSVLLALLGDLTPASDRAKSMAVVGVTIGISFSLALILSPLISQYGGLTPIFYFIAALASLGLILLYLYIPTPAPTLPVQPHRKPFAVSLKNPALQKLNIGIFIQHACLTALFYVLPLRLKSFILLGKLTITWHFYLPIVFASFLIMAPIITIAEKKNHLEAVLKSSIFMIMFSQLFLGWYSSTWGGLIVAVFLYFVAFNLLEALLPSQVSKHASTAERGTAMGIYSTFQFLGIFTGATLAGWIYPHWAEVGVFGINALLCSLWFLMVMTSKAKQHA